MRVEQEQRVTEDARRFAEQEAAAQRYASQMLQVFLLFEILNETFQLLIPFLRQERVAQVVSALHFQP